MPSAPPLPPPLAAATPTRPSNPSAAMISAEMERQAVHASSQLVRWTPLLWLSLTLGLIGPVVVLWAKRDVFRRTLLSPAGPVRVEYLNEGLNITNSRGEQHRMRWNEVDRWLEAPGYLLLVRHDEVGVVVPKDALEPSDLTATMAILRAHLGAPRRRRRTMHSDRGAVGTIVRIAALVIAGVFLIFLALGLILWAIDYGETAPGNNAPARSQPQPSDTPAAVFTEDLSAPLAPDDVPARCANTGTTAQPEWMCWDEDGNPEWSQDELPPPCRMVPYRGNMYMDCEGASGPGR